MEKNEFDELKEIMQTEEDVQFNKRIEKSMTKKLTRKVYKRLLLGFLTVILSIGVVHFGLKSVNYNPLKEDIDFNYLMNAFLWTYVQDHHAEVLKIEDKGFGKYEVTMDIHDISDKWIVGENAYPVQINRSTVMTEDLLRAGIKYPAVNEYDYIIGTGFNNYLEKNIETKNYLMNELKKLPDSAVVIASVNLNTRLDLNQAVDLISKYPESIFTWLAIEGPEYRERSGFFQGINLSSPIGFESLEKYPHFMEIYKNYPNQLTAEQLKNYFLDVLQVLVDHPDFYKMMMENCLNSKGMAKTAYNFLKEQLEYFKTTQNCVGFRIHANPKDLIDIIESGMVSMVWVDDVKLSIYSK